MKPNYYTILERAVAEGSAYGINRAYKYVDNPTRDQIQAEVERAIMSELCECFTFEVSSDG